MERRKIFSPPHFENAEQTQTARFLFALSLPLAVIISIYSIVIILFYKDPDFVRRALYLGILIDINSIVSVLLARRGYPRTASVLFLAVVFFIITGFSLTAGGIEAPASISYFVFIVMTGFLLGEIAGLIAAIICIASITLFVYLELHGLLPPSLLHQTPVTLLATYSMFLSLVALFQWVARRGMRGSLKQANKEIADRKKSELLLKQSEEKFSKMFKTIPNAIIISRLTDGLVIDVNPTFESLFGIPRDEIIGRTSSSFNVWVFPEEREEVINIIRDKGEVLHKLISFRKKDGTIRKGMIACRPFHMDGDECLVFILEDVSEQIEADDALKKSEQQLSQSIEIAHLGHWEYDIASDLFFFNDHFYSIFRTTAEDAGGYTMSSTDYARRFIHPDDAAVVAAEIETALKATDTKFSRQLDHRILYADGKTGYITVRFFIEKDQHGKTVKTYGIIQDITQRKLYEETLRLSEEKFAKAFYNSPDAVSISKLETGQILEINEGFEHAYGYTREESLNKTAGELHLYANPADREKMIQILKTDGKVRNLELTGERKSGELLTGILSVEQIKFDGEPCIVVTMRDITERKRAENALRESEQRFSAMSKASFEGILVHDNGIIVDANQPMADLFGVTSPEDLIGKNGFQLLPLTPESTQRIKEVAASGSTEPYEVMIVQKDGSTYPAETQGRNMFYNGRNLRVVAMRDISSRKRAEETVRENQEKFIKIFHNAPVLMTISTIEEGKFVEVNDQCFEFSGYQPDEIIGKTATGINWISVEERQKMIDVLKEKGRIVDMDLNLRKKNGDIVNRLYSCEIITLHGEKLLLSTSIDITERTQAEHALRESEEKYRLLAENISDVIWTTNLQLKLIYVSPAIEKLLGWTPKEFLQYDLPSHMPPRSAALVVKTFNEEYALKGSPDADPNTSITTELELYRRDKTAAWVEVTARFLRDQHGNVTGIIGVARDITERKHSEEVLRESEERFRIMFDNAANSIALVDMEGHPFKCNPALQKMLGYDEKELASMKFLDFTHPEDRDVDAKLFGELLDGKRKNYHIQKRYIRKDGSIVWAHLNVSLVRNSNNEPLFAIGIVEDITEQKQTEDQKRKLEEQLFHAQKMESIGRMAGGIAHDFNNMLTPILGYSELISKSIKHDKSNKSRLNQIIKAAESSKNLVSQLLAFARKQRLEMKVLNINDVITGFSKILKRTLRENISIKTTLDPALGTILGDVGQVEQIILNLSINAQDAMADGGTIFIETGNISTSQKILVHDETMSEGEYIVLSVSDTGAGIPGDVIPNIFEPFFTTKESGKGTGLGLSTVYGIVKQHQGYVSVYSEIGRGTTFRLYFPRNDNHVSETGHSEPEIEQDVHGKESLVIVEDNIESLDLVTEVLEELGYSVLGFQSCKEVYAKKLPAVKLLITDVILPDGNGKEVYDHLKNNIPDLDVLYMSGYTQDVMLQQNIGDKNINFIQKPFSISTFTHSVRAILDNKKSQ